MAIMDFVKNVDKKMLHINGVKHIMQKQILKIGLVEMMILINLFKKVNYQHLLVLKY
jgi:hypothetical protein